MSAIITSELIELEHRIETGLQTFVEVGLALLAIRDKRLYRESHGTFEDYLIARWPEISRRRAYQLIDAAVIVGNVNNCTQIPATESQARPLARLDIEQRLIAWRAAVDTAPNGKVTAAHVERVVTQFVSPRLAAANHAISDDPNYDGDEWYTPAEYIEAARAVMGGIDLDPASCAKANEIVRAGMYLTKDDDALLPSRQWRGRVWLNPPYSMLLIQRFITKLTDQYTQGNVTEAIVITNNSSDTGWFHALLSRYPACFTRGRVRFWRPNCEAFSTRQGQAIFYLGGNIAGFSQAFADFGIVVGVI